jgi:hypothetical protein
MYPDFRIILGRNLLYHQTVKTLADFEQHMPGKECRV